MVGVLSSPALQRLPVATMQQLRRQSTRSAAYQQHQFDLLVPALQTFQRLHGHWAVPMRFTVPNSTSPEAQNWPEELQSMKLGTTISRFLRACASAKKPSRRRHLDSVKAQLQEVGLPDVEDWKHFLWTAVTIPSMQTYREMHGNLLMQVSFIVPEGDDKWPRATWGYKLGYWASELRRNKGKLLSYQLEDLEALKFSWNARAAHWNQYFSPAIQRYKEIHGNSNVPQTFVVPSNDSNWPAELTGYRLGQKVNNLRCGDPLGTGGSDEAEWQEVELIYKSWMLLETLHDIEDCDVINDEDNVQSTMK